MHKQRTGLIFSVIFLFTLASGPQPVLAADNIFTFPSQRPIAELIYQVKIADRGDHGGLRGRSIQSGPTIYRHNRIMAQGAVKIPQAVALKLYLKYDALTQMKYLDQLSRAQIIHFSASELEIEDSDLLHIKDYHQLERLNLDRTSVSDKSLPLISTFKQLKELRLSGTAVTGAGFEKLLPLRHLDRLIAGGTNLRAGTLRTLQPLMPQLQVLDVSSTGLNKQDAASLASLTAISDLNVAKNALLDDSCDRYFAHLSTLSCLNISDTGITDKIIPILVKLSNLAVVVVRDKTFWHGSRAKKKIGKIVFYDAENTSLAPAEVFTPLH